LFLVFIDASSKKIAQKLFVDGHPVMVYAKKLMTIRNSVINFSLVHHLAVISNGSSGTPKKNGNDVVLISATPNSINVISTIGDI